MPTKNPNCDDECQNGYRIFYFMNVARRTLRFKREICPFCHPETANELQKLAGELVIPVEDFFHLRDQGRWEVETCEDAVFGVNYARYHPVLSTSISKPN